MRAALLGAAIALAFAAGAVAAAPGVSLTAFPTIAPASGSVALSGSIDQPRSGELVTIEGRECGVPGAVFRALAATQTAEGGAFAADFRPRTKTVLRAVWGRAASPEVTVVRRAGLTLAVRPAGRVRITLWGIGRLTGKRVTIERLDAPGSGWRTVRTVRMVSDSTYAESAVVTIPLIASKGTTLRATLPRAQAQPCYLAGYSNLVRM